MVMDLASYAQHPGLRGKAVFITGGGSGIGAAIVESFIHQGSKVAFVDIDDASSQVLCDRLASQYGARPLFLSCDIRDLGALQQAIAKAVSTIGPIDILVNNAASD